VGLSIEMRFKMHTSKVSRRRECPLRVATRKMKKKAGFKRGGAPERIESVNTATAIRMPTKQKVERKGEPGGARKEKSIIRIKGQSPKSPRVRTIGAFREKRQSPKPRFQGPRQGGTLRGTHGKGGE